MYYRCTRQTRLAPAEVVDRLARITRPPQSFKKPVYGGAAWDRTNEPPFVGRADGNSFRLRRIIPDRNDFLPVIIGRVTPLPRGSRIDLTLRVRLPVAIVMTVCLAAAMFGSAAGVWQWVQTGQPRGLFALFLFVLGVTVTAAGFIPEARKAIRLLEDACRAA